MAQMPILQVLPRPNKKEAKAATRQHQGMEEALIKMLNALGDIFVLGKALPILKHTNLLVNLKVIHNLSIYFIQQVIPGPGPM